MAYQNAHPGPDDTNASATNGLSQAWAKPKRHWLSWIEAIEATTLQVALAMQHVASLHAGGASATRSDLCRVGQIGVL
jgi:hypothetical protein